MKQLLPQRAQYYKTNLHTHSTVSDGTLTPKEVKDLYKGLGYQVLCITDHQVIVDHSNLNDPDFLMLTGVEVNHNNKNYRPRYDGQVYHLNLIAKRPDLLWAPGSVRHKYPGAAPYEDAIDYAGMCMGYDVDAVNAMIAAANEKGFLVFYNHPDWSCQSYPDYAPLRGLWGVEVRNTECVQQTGLDTNNTRVFKELLNVGNRRLCPLGTDDMHYRPAAGGAWIMVGAEALSYESVIRALEQGDLYMSCGPEIYSLTVDGTALRITCSEATRICVGNHGRFGRTAVAQGGELLTEAEFDLSAFLGKAEGDPNAYIYVTVTDAKGQYAMTRPYYLEDLQEEER